jgi:crotonobetainyl-CoA:carnitine CoA-transferase CaiB-like acyl-CoA transferase
MACAAPAAGAADIIRRSSIAPAMPLPLSHIRVLDLSRVLAGPWASQNLADLGAEVLKIERPGSGDDTRSWGPPFLKDKDGKETRESAYFLSVNRGKKSVTLDISKPEGQRIARALAAKCDVLLENYKVGGLAKYGLAYEDLRKINPRIIYCSITGFGQSGPSAHRPGYDFIFQGMGGLMSITGERDGEPGGGPQKVGIAVTDVLAGMYASLAITAAIAHRERTGVGQVIDLALFDAVVAFGANQILNYFTSGKIPGRYGNAHANVVPYEVFATADGHLILAVGNDSQFASFCKIAGRPELATDSRYATMPGRITNRATLIPLLREILRERPSGRWLTELEAGNVPCGPINNYKEVFEDPQVRHRGLKVEIPHPSGIPRPTVASPMRFSETRVEYAVPPPLLGEHTREVLHSLLGLESGELDRLAAQKII